MSMPPRPLSFGAHLGLAMYQYQPGLTRPSKLGEGKRQSHSPPTGTAGHCPIFPLFLLALLPHYHAGDSKPEHSTISILIYLFGGIPATRADSSLLSLPPCCRPTGPLPLPARLLDCLGSPPSQLRTPPARPRQHGPRCRRRRVVVVVVEKVMADLQDGTLALTEEDEERCWNGRSWHSTQPLAPAVPPLTTRQTSNDACRPAATPTRTLTTACGRGWS